MTLGIQPVFFSFYMYFVNFPPGLDISVSARYKGFLATTIIIIISTYGWLFLVFRCI